MSWEPKPMVMNQRIIVNKIAKPSSAFRTVRYLFVCVLLFVSSLDDALALEQGEIPAASLRYDEWLKVNKGNQEYLSVLFHLALLADSARDVLAVLNSYSKNLPPTQSAVISARMAALESLIGLPREAAGHYEMASKIGGEMGELYLLDSVKLKLVMGEYSEVREIAFSLANSAREAIIRDEAAAIAALSLAHRGDGEGALAELERYSSAPRIINSSYFWLIQLDIAQSYGYPPPTRAISALTSDFKNSTIKYIAENRIQRWDMPSTLVESDVRWINVEPQLLPHPNAASEKDAAVDAFREEGNP